MSVSAEKVIRREGYFWGQKAITDLLEKEQVDTLLANELHDWLSVLYWSEGLAAEYALRMQSLVPAPNKNRWQHVFRDEVNHQIRIGAWLAERSLAPLPPNPSAKFARKHVEKISKDTPKEELYTAILNSQLFFEEYLHRLLKWRTPFVLDRDLKSALYRIAKDEIHHIHSGQRELREFGFEPVDFDKLLRSNTNLLFPLHLGPRVLSVEQFAQVRKVVPAIVEHIFFEQKAHAATSLVPSIARFENLPGYRCIACSPAHESGLHLEPKLDRERNLAWDEVSFSRRMQGFNNIVHGGVIATALDEMLGYSAILCHSVLALTKTLEVTYLAPLLVDTPYLIEAQILSQEGQAMTGEVVILDPKTKKCHAKAKGSLHKLGRKLAGRLFPELVESQATSGLFLEDAADARR